MCNNQKLPEMFYKKGVLKHFANSQKTPVPEVATFQACNFIKKRFQNRCFPVDIVKFLWTTIWRTSVNGCFCHFVQCFPLFQCFPTLAQVFSSEFCEIRSLKHLFYRTPSDDCFRITSLSLTLIPYSTFLKIKPCTKSIFQTIRVIKFQTTLCVDNKRYFKIQGNP